MARPRKPYRTSWGEFVNGLRQHGSNRRWLIVDSGETFTEPDERLAVAKFKRWQARQQRADIPLGKYRNGKHVSGVSAPDVQIRRHPIQGKAEDFDIIAEVGESGLWAWFREQLITRPEFVADMVGIPEVGRLADLPKRQPSPRLEKLGAIYTETSEATPHHKRNMGKWWDSFATFMHKHDVKTLRGLTPQLCAAYADEIKAGTDSPRYIRHRFNGIRTILNFARKRGENPHDCRHALDCCAVMEAPKHKNGRNPQPISKDDLQALLDATDNPKMKASLLVMLNLAMYPGEALALNWSDVDLKRKTVVTERPKTGVVRIGVLWDRTLAALQSLDRSSTDGPIFLSEWGNRWHSNTYNWNWRKLRTAAGLGEDVKAEHLRDGAYTAAIESGIDLNQAKLLAGHSTGITDYYAKRRPTMVADACKAIEAAYF